MHYIASVRPSELPDAHWNTNSRRCCSGTKKNVNVWFQHPRSAQRLLLQTSSDWPANGPRRTGSGKHNITSLWRLHVGLQRAISRSFHLFIHTPKHFLQDCMRLLANCVKVAMEVQWCTPAGDSSAVSPPVGSVPLCDFLYLLYRQAVPGRRNRFVLWRRV